MACAITQKNNQDQVSLPQSLLVTNQVNINSNVLHQFDRLSFYVVSKSSETGALGLSFAKLQAPTQEKEDRLSFCYSIIEAYTRGNLVVSNEKEKSINYLSGCDSELNQSVKNAFENTFDYKVSLVENEEFFTNLIEFLEEIAAKESLEEEVVNKEKESKISGELSQKYMPNFETTSTEAEIASALFSASFLKPQKSTSDQVKLLKIELEQEFLRILRDINERQAKKQEEKVKQEILDQEIEKLILKKEILNKLILKLGSVTYCL